MNHGRSLNLSVPAEDSFLDLIRSGVGRFARLDGFSFDGIEDLALAVNEAAALLLQTMPEQLAIGVSSPDGDGLVIQVDAVGATGPWPPPEVEQDLRWQVLWALCDEVRYGDGAALVLVQRRR